MKIFDLLSKGYPYLEQTIETTFKPGDTLLFASSGNEQGDRLVPQSCPNMYEVSAPDSHGHGKPKHSLFVNLNKTEVTLDMLEKIVKASEDAKTGFPSCSPEKIDRREWEGLC